MKAILYPVKTIDGNVEKCELSEAQMFGVYLCNDEHEIWFADFDTIEQGKELTDRLNFAFNKLTELRR